MKNPILNYYKKLLKNDYPDFIDKYLSVPSLLRLKNIGYFCGMDYASKDVYNFQEHITRFDHSLTVALITWNFTKDKKATLSGLFHDVATPCFAHVIDYMNKDYANQESTEEYTEHILKEDKKLNKLLAEDDISISDITNFKKYPIVDNNRPRLCADRLDGIILTGIGWTKTITKEDIKKIISDIVVYKNEENIDELGFKTKDIAKLAWDTSKQIDILCHSNEDNFMMELLASIARRAIEISLINYDDLYKLTEDKLFEMFKRSNDSILKESLAKFENIKIDEIPETILENVKIRNLNPLVAENVRLFNK